MKEIKHGSAWTYYKYACRCEHCLKAHQENVQKKKVMRMSKGKSATRMEMGKPILLDDAGMKRREDAKQEMRRLIETRTSAIHRAYEVES